MALFIIFSLLALFYLAMISYYVAGWHKTNRFQFNSKRQQPTTKISILVPVRNEGRHIENCLYHILQQEYPKHLMEVLVIDDFSSDNTLDLVEQQQDERIRVLRLQDQYNDQEKLTAPKKQALELGIHLAKGHLIITTDGDCQMGKRWLANIVSYYEQEQPKMIAAPVLFKKERSFLGRFQALDMLSMMGVTCATITNKCPVMCNGANLAFEKNLFYEVGGYQQPNATATGDDVFLMLKVHKQYPGEVVFLNSKDAVVTTAPVPTWQDFFDQRKRWISKASKFGNWRITLVLGLSYLFNLSIIINTIAGIIWMHQLAILALATLLLKLIADLVFLLPVSRFFQQKSLFWGFIPIQLTHILYVVIMGVVANFGHYQWKGRKLR